MPVLEFPTMCVADMHMTSVYLSADNVSVNQYCTDNGYTLVSYDNEYQRFSNDGALPYQYWTGTEWKLEFGFRQIVAKITYTV